MTLLPTKGGTRTAHFRSAIIFPDPKISTKNSVSLIEVKWLLFREAVFRKWEVLQSTIKVRFNGPQRSIKFEG